jgi:hypothetical protein
MAVFPTLRLLKCGKPLNKIDGLANLSYFAANATAGCADFSCANFDDVCAFVE